MKVYILHHDDSDGYCAAAAFKYFGEKYFNDVEYHAVDYGRKLPIMEDNSTVYILDYSISLEELNALVERMDNVLILDHHASALKRLLGHENAYIDITRSGAMIAFEYFRQKFGLVYHDVPEFVKYVQDQDFGLFKLPDSVEVKNYNSSVFELCSCYSSQWIKTIGDEANNQALDLVENMKWHLNCKAYMDSFILSSVIGFDGFNLTDNGI